MKILMINTLYYPNVFGGAERSVQVLAESLVQAGHDVSVISINPTGYNYNREVKGVKVFYVALKNLYWPSSRRGVSKYLKPVWHALDSFNIAMGKKIGRIIDKENPNLVHTHNLAGFSVAVWRETKARGLPLVHTLRGYYLLCPRMTMFKNNRNCRGQCKVCRLYSYPRKRATCFVDVVVGISHFVLDRHLNLGFFKNTPVRDVIPNQITMKAELSPNAITGRTVRFGYLGRLERPKGVELAFQALENIPTQDWELWVAGTGIDAYVSKLKRRYSRPNIHFIGFAKPEELFKKIDVLLVPSLWNEPFGRVIIEAYAFGIPVIGSKRGGIPEIICNGKTGFIFDPDEPGSLEAAICRLIKDPKIIDQLRPIAFKEARNFSSEHIVMRYLTIYKRALEANVTHWR